MVSVQICIFAFRMTKDAVLVILWQTFLYFNKISKLTVLALTGGNTSKSMLHHRPSFLGGTYGVTLCKTCVTQDC